MKRKRQSGWVLCGLLAGLGLPACSSAHAQISLASTVNLALQNSSQVRIASAKLQQARGVLSEARGAYIPNFYVGAGLGYSVGFPLGTPNLFNAESQSLLLSFSQPDYIRSARAAIQAAQFSLQDVQQQVELDTATAYVDLDKTNRQLSALHDAMENADQLIVIMDNRVAAGVASRVDLTRARLTRAQMQLQQMQLEDHAEQLRQQIAALTGLPANSITLDAGSIPALPDPSTVGTPQAAQNPAVQAAQATANSFMYTAFGDSRQNYRPVLQQVMQYSLFSTFNNYQNYYTSFQQNNFGFEVQITIPLFDPIHRAKSIESNAAASMARHQAEQAQTQITAQGLALQHQLRELRAEQDVASLQQQLAQDTLQSLQAQMQNGSGSATAPPVTPQQALQARMDERNRAIDKFDADFAVERVQLQLLRQTGGLSAWIKSSQSILPAK
jgi:outer membrane protein TolC